jgi:hypothetical protein
MITASAYFVIMFLVCHLLGDYILGQSDWMALNKSKQTIPCLAHVILYTSFFLILTFSWKALLFIGVTHFVLDRFPIIIKRLIWLKNHLNPQLEYAPFEFCDSTGYYDDSPYNSVIPTESYWEKKFGKPRHFHITIFLYIVTDNTLHLICNFIALTYLT